MAQYEVIERAGISYESISDAVKTIVSDAHAEKLVSWFEVKEYRGRGTEDGKVEFQVAVLIGRKA